MEVKGRKLESENISVLFCEPCEVENSKTSANGACRECKDYMCTVCFRHHLKSKQCRHHVLLSLEEFSSLTLDCGSEDVIKCNKHDNEIIKFYCRSHDVTGCGDCIVLEHTSCKPEYIKDLAKTFTDRDVYKSIVKRVEDLRKKKSDYEQEIVKSKDEIKKMDEMARKEIREFRKEINKYLDEAEANLLSEMKKVRKENTGKLEKIEKNLQSLTSELKTMTRMLNTQLHHGNALFINAVNCKSKLNDLKTMYENTTKEKTLKEVEFVRNKHMSELLKASEPLGSLKTEHDINCMMRGSMMNWRGAYFDMRRPFPAVARGPSPQVMRGPSPAVARGPSPQVMRGPSPAVARGQSPQMMKRAFSAVIRRPSVPVMNEQAEFVVGSRVRRGPHWAYGHEDGGGQGTITGFDFSGLAYVEWDNGQTYNYRIGQDNSYELEII